MVDLVEEKRELLMLLEERERRQKRRRFYHYFPDETHVFDGQEFFARHLYPKHLEFFAAGAKYRERAFLAANRVGKTEGGGGYELTCHLTGLYPDWWEGKRFERPISAWAAGVSNETARDILQAKLLAPSSTVRGDRCPAQPDPGRSDRDTEVEAGRQRPDRHRADPPCLRGGNSVLGLKSYQQGRESFEGTEKDVILLDEEPPADIYGGECLVRTATTRGLVMLTFTPLKGLSEVVLSFLPGGHRPGDN